MLIESQASGATHQQSSSTAHNNTIKQPQLDMAHAHTRTHASTYMYTQPPPPPHTHIYHYSTIGTTSERPVECRKKPAVKFENSENPRQLDKAEELPPPPPPPQCFLLLRHEQCDLEYLAIQYSLHRMNSVLHPTKIRITRDGKSKRGHCIMYRWKLWPRTVQSRVADRISAFGLWLVDLIRFSMLTKSEPSSLAAHSQPT